MGVTVKLIFATLVIGAGSGFQHGYNIGVVNAPQGVIVEWMTATYISRGSIPSEGFITTLWGFAVSIFCLGGILGGATSSLFSSHLGRRGALLVNNIFAIIAGVLMFLSKYVASPELFIVGRFITGYNCGLNSGICTMYLVEIATTAMRGAIGTVYQLIITVSILLSQIAGLKPILGTHDRWPVCFGLIAVIGVLQAALLPICPESPKYLFVKKGEDKAKAALAWLRGTNEVEGEMGEIRAEYAKEQTLGRATLGQMFSNPLLRKPLIVSVLIMLAQQLSGINAVIFYSTSTFIKAGFSEKGAQCGTLVMGVMNILMTIVSMFLVDIAGRRTLLLAGFILMMIITLCLTVTLSFIDKAGFLSAISVVLVVSYVVSFAIGPGSIPWFLVSEFFTQDARPLAAAIAVAANWIANFIVGMAFLPLQEMMGPLVFIIFVAFQLIFIIYIFLVVPETKNKTYEEVSSHFQ